jgi:hypothetical protein
LRKDFEDRCAYSLVHWKTVADANSCMHVDHFNPTISGRKRNAYSNLMLATERSNLAKGEKWPSSSERRKGIRILNPTKELELGVHIVEHSVSHKLIPRTPAGAYHIISLDLNSDQLVEARADRAAEFAFQDRVAKKVRLKKHVPFSAAAECLQRYSQKADYLIPLFPHGTKKEEEAFDAQEAADAALITP